MDTSGECWPCVPKHDCQRILNIVAASQSRGVMIFRLPDVARSHEHRIRDARERSDDRRKQRVRRRVAQAHREYELVALLVEAAGIQHDPD
jgi:hypothetical protein